MSKTLFTILLVIALTLFTLTRILPCGPVAQLGTNLFLTVFLLVALYRFYVSSGRKRSLLIVFILCLALEAASFVLSILELVS